MQTETRPVTSLDMGSTGLLSLAMTALRLSKPTIIQPRERIINLEEVSWHDHEKDCWVIIYDRVFDLTNFLDEHPGGAEVLLEYAGRDATLAFRGVGHSKAAIRALDRFLIGELPMHERIFRKKGGILISEIPA